MEKGVIVFKGHEVPVFGKYRKNILFGAFDQADLLNVRIYAQECEYIIEAKLEDQFCMKVRIYSADLKKWGWLKKLWSIDPETQEPSPDYVYGYWLEGKGKPHFMVKYSVVPQFLNLAEMKKKLQEGKRVMRNKRMQKILIPDLEKDPSQFRHLWQKK